ncbi:hypothetical protein [Paenibacillus sp. NEAU-GSW1]|uniref:hypothetical protein n=1 Tax=Paenibacillus sp. NEAU-GSW1 TaxID=2682486 RepID=UPI0015644032|nr:hypothetical protein [Paenibacillus sp. NEAU-GSW1]
MNIGLDDEAESSANIRQNHCTIVDEKSPEHTLPATLAAHAESEPRLKAAFVPKSAADSRPLVTILIDFRAANKRKSANPRKMAIFSRSQL